MVNSTKVNKKQAFENKDLKRRFKKLASIGEISKEILSDIASPLDATNRFINLAMHSIGDGDEGRQFLIQSKEGIRKTSVLLEKLNLCARKLEEEMRHIAEEEMENGQRRYEKRR